MFHSKVFVLKELMKAELYFVCAFFVKPFSVSDMFMLFPVKKSSAFSDVTCSLVSSFCIITYKY